MSVRFLHGLTTNYLCRKLGINSDIDQTTYKPEIVYPAQEFHYQKSYFLENQLSKVTSVPFSGNVATEFKKLSGGKMQLGPILRFHIKDAFVTPKYVFSGRYRKIFSIAEKDTLPMQFDELKHGIVVSSMHGCNYFGHWLRDDCATYLLTKTYQGTFCKMATPEWSDKTHYSNLFDQDWAITKPAYCRQLSFFIDHGQNPHKAERFRKLRDMIRNGKNTTAKSQIVYIKRGPTAKQRQLVNEDELIDLLMQMGVHIHNAEEGIGTLTRDYLDTRIIISVEGSQISHGLYSLKDGGGVLVIQPPDRLFNSHLDWAQQLDMKYAFVVGDAVKGGFSVNIEEFKRTLDMLENAISA